MKKFYAFALLAATVMSANALGNNTVTKLEKTPVPVDKIDFNHHVDMKRVDAIRANHQNKMSRAEADLTALDIQYYNSYFDDAWMSNATTVTDNGDGTITIHDFMGLGFDFMGAKSTLETANGTYDVINVPLGQTFPHSSYLLKLASVTQSGLVDVEGTFTFVNDDNELWPGQYYLGIYAFDPDSGNALGFYDLAYYYAVRKSNCTINYTFVKADESGDMAFDDFSMRCIYEIYQDVDDNDEPMFDTDGNPVLSLELTGINAIEGMNGCMTYWEINNAEKSLLAVDQVIYPSLNAGGKQTGDFIMTALDENSLEALGTEIKAVFNTDNDGNYTGFEFGSWLPQTESGYWFSYLALGPTTVTFDNVENLSGISNVSVDNSNAPVEIYNIQGQKINNPAAGQVYIVKQGNSVKKAILK